MPAVEDLIKFYFPVELSITEILIIYAQSHHMIISIQTLKTHCRKLHLFRQKDQTDLDEAIAFVGRTMKWTDAGLLLVTSMSNTDGICGTTEHNTTVH